MEGVVNLTSTFAIGTPDTELEEEVQLFVAVRTGLNWECARMGCRTGCREEIYGNVES